MSKTFKLAVSAAAAQMDPRAQFELKKDPGYVLSSTYLGNYPGAAKPMDAKHVQPVFYLKRAIYWKGAPELMAEGVRTGLGKAIALSKAAMDTLGVTVDPRTGRLVPRKGLRQRELAPKVTPMTAAERRAKARAKTTAVGKAAALKLSIPTV